MHFSTTVNEVFPFKSLTHSFSGSVNSFRDSSVASLVGLILTDSFNSMAQRAYIEFTDTYKQRVHVEIDIYRKQMIDDVERHDLDLIICPFLTNRIPK